MANSFDDEDDGFKSGSEDELFLADKDWKKMQQRSLKEGFREGLDQANEDQLQAGFDSAYAKSFIVGRDVGRVKGKLAAKMVLLQDSEEKLERLKQIETDISSLKSQDLHTSKDALEKLSNNIDNV